MSSVDETPATYLNVEYFAVAEIGRKIRSYMADLCRIFNFSALIECHRA